MSFSSCTQSTRRDSWRLTVLAAAVALLLVKAAASALNVWWRVLPFAVLAAGLLRIVWSQTRRGRIQGIAVALLGGTCVLGTYYLFGLSWRIAWPLMLISIGVTMIVDALADNRVRHEA